MPSYTQTGKTENSILPQAGDIVEFCNIFSACPNELCEIFGVYDAKTVCNCTTFPITAIAGASN
jgi:hypothetical protein